MRRDLCGRRSRHGMSAFVGIDVHYEMTYATVLELDGRVVAQRKLLNESIPELLKLFNVERVGRSIKRACSWRFGGKERKTKKLQ